ncbi:helix-turn-helix domain-containing protein [Lactococcus lactis]|uniref:helix-turn-helix domain-containing protein n=1 Tax=Lactococcus lactis TaxID=1358 RepID=UPI000C9F5A80|nr:helix-turn-helix domain-containing protein [Lactococcus lactis]AUS69634.1 hypothetical protein LLG50_05955 [Lactococcus lactis subsp. lactis]
MNKKWEYKGEKIRNMLLANARKKDLDVLYIICTSIKTTYSSIEIKTKITYRTIKAIIKRLNENIYNAFELEGFIISNNKGEVFINSKFISEKFRVFFSLRLYWYKDSSLLKLLTLIVSEGEITRERAADELYLTESGLNKFLKKINQYLKLFSLRISSNRGVLTFSGDEVIIRNFLFKYLYYTYLNLEWPFRKIDIHEIEKISDELFIYNEIYFSDSRSRAFSLFVIILKNRYRAGKYIKSIPDNLIEILEVLHSKRESSILKSNFEESIPDQYKKSEAALIDLFFRMYVPEIDSEEVQNEIGMIFSSLDNRTCQLMSKIITSLDNQFILNKDDKKNIRIYQLVLFVSIYTVFNTSLVPFIYMHFPKPTYHLNTNDNIMKVIKSVVDKTGNLSKERIDIVSSFLYSLYITHFHQKVCIYLEFSKDIAASYYVKNRIRSIYNNENIIFVSNFKVADLIVTDTYDIKKDSEKFFFLLSTNDEKGWKDLIFDIQNLVMEKIF